MTEFSIMLNKLVKDGETTSKLMGILVGKGYKWKDAFRLAQNIKYPKPRFPNLNPR